MTRRLRASLLVLLGIHLTVVKADDAPDSEVNQATGQIESVHADVAGSGYDLRHTVDPGQGGPRETVLLTNASENDLRPRMAITPAGAAWVVWWRDSAVDAVLCRIRDTSGAWQPEQPVSAAGEGSRNPEIVLHDGSPWVAYEYTASGGTGIGVVAIDDTPDPFGRTQLGTSSLASGVDVQIHSTSGHLWVTWVQDGARVGWSEFESITQTWLPVQFEPYAAGEGVAAARSRVVADVLAP